MSKLDSLSMAVAYLGIACLAEDQPADLLAVASLTDTHVSYRSPEHKLSPNALETHAFDIDQLPAANCDDFRAVAVAYYLRYGIGLVLRDISTDRLTCSFIIGNGILTINNKTISYQNGQVYDLSCLVNMRTVEASTVINDYDDFGWISFRFFLQFAENNENFSYCSLPFEEEPEELTDEASIPSKCWSRICPA